MFLYYVLCLFLGIIYDDVTETLNDNQKIGNIFFCTSHGPNLQNQLKNQF